MAGVIGPSRPGYQQGTADTQSTLSSYNNALSSGQGQQWLQNNASNISANGGSIPTTNSNPTPSNSNPSPSNSGGGSNNNSSSNNGPDLSGLINQLYQSQTDYLSGLKNTMDTNKTTDLAATDTNYAAAQNTQKANLGVANNQYAQDQNTFGNSFLSSWAQALKQYQGESQSGRSLYGGYGGQTSAATGIGEYINQLGAGVQGDLQNNLSQGNLQLAGENQGIQQWDATNQQTNTQNYNLAKQNINDTYNQGLASIAQSQAMTNMEKTNAQLSLLQQAINEHTNLDNMAIQQKNQMQLYSQINAGGAFNPAAYQATLLASQNGMASAGTGMGMGLNAAGIPQNQTQNWFNSAGASGNSNNNIYGLLGQTGANLGGNTTGSIFGA